jgi:molybdate transport system substrate-binding protein
MKMRRLPAILLLVILIVAGCSPTAAPTPAPQTLTVFAAASLTEAFTEIGQRFEDDNPDVTVTFNFAGSQALRTQIEEGAPADVFASANKTEIEKLIESSFVAQDAPQIFLTNKLVVILPADNPAELNQLEDLSRPGIKLVLAAEEVPVGKYARQALDAMNGQYGKDFKEKVLANVVSNEDNVRQVVAKVQLGEADAGIVYTSDAIAAQNLKTIEITAELNVVAEYPIAALNQATNPELANGFIAFLLSEDGLMILQKWGFASPG